MDNSCHVTVTIKQNKQSVIQAFMVVRFLKVASSPHLEIH